MSDRRVPSALAVPVPEVTPEELRRCADVLRAIAADRALLGQLSQEERQALLLAAARAIDPEPQQKRQLLHALRAAKRRADETHDRKLRAGTGIRAARTAPVFVPPPALSAGASSAAEPQAPQEPQPELKKPKTCYACKREYRRLHFFYDALCPACADFNYEKRCQSVPLAGRIALVTGARVKIGYYTALKLLRAGATVVATTRFPHDAARRYAAEPDAAEWRERLHVHGLDLRHAPSVEIFCRFLRQSLPHLDLLINNACQTVRRPPGFYSHMLDFEEQASDTLPPDVRLLLRGHDACVAALSGAARLSTGAAHDDDGGLVAWSGGGAGLGLRASARLSQVRYDFDDAARRPDLFPVGRLDADLQQLDLRAQNTWRLTLDEVPTPEMIEVQLVNAVAPFILCGQLKPLMMKTATRDRHIVNVSAMEGIFARGTKTDRHPHTNMAKAALNMLTLTSARGYAEDGIYMNAVDTGWITDEDPAAHADRKRDELDFQPPLDVVDGAARLVDPFFTGLRTGEHVWGKFLKDYKPSSW